MKRLMEGRVGDGGVPGGGDVGVEEMGASVQLQGTCGQGRWVVIVCPQR